MDAVFFCPVLLYFYLEMFSLCTFGCHFLRLRVLYIYFLVWCYRVKLKVFREKLLHRHPVVFKTWFLRTFPDPTSWSVVFLRTAKASLLLADMDVNMGFVECGGLLNARVLLISLLIAHLIIALLSLINYLHIF